MTPQVRALPLSKTLRIGRQIRRVTPLLALLLAVSTLPSIGVEPALATAQAVIDTTNRDAVVNSYNAEFSRGEPEMGWSAGSSGDCDAGTTSQAFRDSMISRVNWYRAMGGVPAVITEDTAKSAQAQETALMMARTGRLSHHPDDSFSCYTATGADMAGKSNLALGLHGLAAIDGYMLDPGSKNTAVGHRNWILHPPTQTMGTGDIPSGPGRAANSLYVFNNVFGEQPEVREAAGFIAWPPRGYVPGEVVYARWSFGLRGSDMSGAQVTVTRDGFAVDTPVVHRSAACSLCGSAPFPIVVFEPQGVNTNPRVDTTYSVTITGINVNGSVQNHSYTVAILGDNPSPSSGNCRQGPVNPIYSAGDPIRAAVYRLYCAYFLRHPDLKGHDYWYGVQVTGSSYKTISDSFALSQEFSDRYGPLSNNEFIELVYQNVLERTPDAAGHGYWLGLMATGRASKGDVMLYFSDSQEFKNSTGTN